MKTGFLIKSGILIVLGSGTVAGSCKQSDENGTRFRDEEAGEVHQNIVSGNQGWMTGYFTIGGGLKGEPIERIEIDLPVTGKIGNSDTVMHRARLTIYWYHASYQYLYPPESGDISVSDQYTTFLQYSSQRHRSRFSQY